MIAGQLGGTNLTVETTSPRVTEDLELMRRIADRDPAALRALYDRHAGLVYSIALRILRKPEDAEELVVDVFQEIWDKSSRYDQSRAAPVTYLVTLTRSRCIDRTRRKAYRAQTTLEAIEDAAPLSDHTPADDVLLGEQQALVRGALSRLDENQRVAIEAAYYDGLSHSEIAQKLGKPLGTVKTYIRQGLIRLRDAMRSSG